MSHTKGTSVAGETTGEMVLIHKDSLPTAPVEMHDKDTLRSVQLLHNTRINAGGSESESSKDVTVVPGDEISGNTSRSTDVTLGVGVATCISGDALPAGDLVGLPCCDEDEVQLSLGACVGELATDAD